MCGSGCGGLFEAGKPLDKVTCPCKCGYWDIWKLAFMDGDMIRAGQAPSREDYVKELEAELPAEERESRIRVQGWIRHFLTCRTKRDSDDRATRQGSNDGSSIRKALTEWWEFERGDYTSHGTSGTLDATTLSGIWERVRGGERLSQQEFDLLLPPSPAPRAEPKGSVSSDRGSSPVAVPNEANTSRPVPPPDLVTAVAPVTGGASAMHDYFIPEERLRQDVLTYHCVRGMFGPAATVSPFTYPDGRRGFVIRGTVQPTQEMIKQVMNDSAKATDNKRERPDSDRQTSTRKSK